jgi:hypothetical protein
VQKAAIWKRDWVKGRLNAGDTKTEVLKRDDSIWDKDDNSGDD